ncbi:hypothetical protein IQ238_26510 [Pleurocapsales cyanobacterium LEGE 06147]|nr:hypothetical protein [Pleurocapsales cyanobacterium LEGE 06147]
MLSSLKALLSSVVDYAGLFPPAKLSLKEAIANYVRYNLTPYSWMLGRFVLPVSQLTQLETLLAHLPSEHGMTKPLSLSAILSEDWELELDQIQSLNNTDKINIPSVEFKPLLPKEIEKVIPLLPTGVESFFEISFNQNLETYLAVLQGTGTAAKIRTGGLTADAFPNADQLCRFMFASAEAKVPFKATAGLHHAFRGEYPLSYEPNSLSTAMPGFINVAILAALVYWQKITYKEALTVLKESSSHFQFKENNIIWQDKQLTISELEESRQFFFRSFGSCSFQEPLDDLRQLQLLS